MRRNFVILGIALLLAACAPGEAPEEEESAAEPAAAAEEMAEEMAPEAEAVAQLNELCPENWCAGDFTYEFQAIECGDASCTLSFTAERGGETLEGSVDFDFDEPLIDEFGDLEAGYFERVTDALDIWEAAQSEG